MTREHLSPEAHALLQEVSEDPDTAIRRLAEHANRKPTAGRRRTEEAAAKQLAEVHRYEAALLLARHAQQQHFSDPFWQGLLHRSLHVGEDLQVPRREDVTRDAVIALRSGAVRDDDKCHLNRILDQEPPCSAFEAVQASWRILGTDVAAMILTVEYMRHEQWDPCRRLLDFSLEQGVSSLNRSIAWEQTGALMIRTGRIPDAIDAYRRSAATEPSRPTPLLFAFMLSALFGAETRRIAEEAEDMVSESDSVVFACIEAIKALRSQGVLESKIDPTARRSKLIAGPATSRIVDAVL